MLWVFEKSIFQLFASVWVTKLKSIFGKVTESVETFFNQNLALGSFLEDGFEAILSSKMNVLNIWKDQFWVFCKFLSDEVEVLFWQSGGKRSKLFKSKPGHRKLPRKRSWAQKRLFWVFENIIFQFFVNLWLTKLKPFFGKVRQSVQNHLNESVVIGNFSGNGFEATFTSETNALCVFFFFFFFFANFWVMKLKTFSGKIRHSVQSYLNQNRVVGSFLYNGLQSIFSSKAIVLSVWKEDFSGFCKSLIDEVGTIIRERDAKR